MTPSKIFLLSLSFFSVAAMSRGFALEESKSEQVIQGSVVRIVDGDSIVVKEKDGTEQMIHLEGIDAPEIKQSFGDDATKELTELLKGKDIEVKWSKKDDYQRILGRVYLADKFVNLHMLEKGLAWHFKRYFPSEEFAAAESKAKAAKAGLWTESSPTPPWDYRKQNRNAEKDTAK